jgi:hypothetical protein
MGKRRKNTNTEGMIYSRQMPAPHSPQKRQHLGISNVIVEERTVRNWMIRAGKGLGTAIRVYHVHRIEAEFTTDARSLISLHHAVNAGDFRS